jgi:hypothetical protein
MLKNGLEIALAGMSEEAFFGLLLDRRLALAG